MPIAFKNKGGRRRGVGRFFIASLHLYRFEQRGLVKNSLKKNEWRLILQRGGAQWEGVDMDIDVARAARQFSPPKPHCSVVPAVMSGRLWKTPCLNIPMAGGANHAKHQRNTPGRERGYRVEDS